MRLMRTLIATFLAAAIPAIAQPLETDPRLVTGTLDNGLHYIVRKNNNPPNRADIWMHVSTGSLNETDKQRGIAHYTEHMAFNGSEHFPPGSVIDFFQSMGMTFGQHQNAFTSLDQTVYQLGLPDNKPETLQKGMLFMSDVAGKLSMLPKEIENERQVIQEERRTRLGGQQRVQDYWLAHLAPGSILGQRIPIGIEETINSVQQQDFKDYYTKWYVPSNMTVMVVADLEPAAVVEQIKANFSGGVKVPKPKDQDTGIKPYDTTRAIVASDAELTNAQVGMIWLYPPKPPLTTVESVRDVMIDQIATWCFDRRIQKKVSAGKVSFQGGGAGTNDLFHAARLAMVTVSGEPSKWKAMLSEIAAETQRARLYGFTEVEVADARKELLSDAERAVEVEPTMNSRSILGIWNGAIAGGEPITSAAQDLEVQRKVLPSISAADVSKRFKEEFDASKPVTFSLQMPSGADVPTEEQLIEMGKKALDVKPENEVQSARPTALMDKLPELGQVLEATEHEASKVTSAWLSNGARVHYRFMDYKKDQVIVSIVVTGGEIQETAENRGISQAAGLALGRPATSKLTSSDIVDLMTGKKVQAGGRPAQDAFMVSVGGSPVELETGMQLAHLILTDPKVEAAALDKWKEQIKQGNEMRRKMVEGVFGEVIVKTLYPPGELRPTPVENEQAAKITPEDATAWLKQVLATGAIEVSVVGDIQKDKAMELVARYIGSLPKRDRISDTTLAGLRTIKRPVGPLAANRQMETKTDKAMVVSGFFGTDAKNIRDTRLLSVATRILSTRAINDIREKQQLAYAPQVGSTPGTEYPAYGMVVMFSPTAPDKVPALLSATTGLYDSFAKDGPTAEEMETVKKQIANSMDEQMREPGFWSTRLTTLDYRGTSIDDVLGGPAAYAAFTADEVRDAFVRYYKKESRFEVYVTPGAEEPKKE